MNTLTHTETHSVDFDTPTLLVYLSGLSCRWFHFRSEEPLRVVLSLFRFCASFAVVLYLCRPTETTGGVSVTSYSVLPQRQCIAFTHLKPVSNKRDWKQRHQVEIIWNRGERLYSIWSKIMNEASVCLCFRLLVRTFTTHSSPGVAPLLAACNQTSSHSMCGLFKSVSGPITLTHFQWVQINFLH